MLATGGIGSNANADCCMKILSCPCCDGRLVVRGRPISCCGGRRCRRRGGLVQRMKHASRAEAKLADAVVVVKLGSRIAESARARSSSGPKRSQDHSSERFTRHGGGGGVLPTCPSCPGADQGLGLPPPATPAEEGGGRADGVKALEREQVGHNCGIIRNPEPVVLGRLMRGAHNSKGQPAQECCIPVGVTPQLRKRGRSLCGTASNLREAEETTPLHQYRPRGGP